MLVKVTDYGLALLGAPGSRGVTTYAPLAREGERERARQRQREAEREFLIHPPSKRVFDSRKRAPIYSITAQYRCES